MEYPLPKTNRLVEVLMNASDPLTKDTLIRSIYGLDERSSQRMFRSCDVAFNKLWWRAQKKYNHPLKYCRKTKTYSI